MSKAPTVFVVDDDEAMQESLSWVIQSVGLPVKTFSSAQAFLAEYEPKQTGCLLLDVRMNGMSGPELQTQLNALNIKIPIIFISGHGDIPLAVRAMKAGAIDFLTKPCNDQVLLESINKAIQIDTDNRKENEARLKATKIASQLTPREHEVMSRITAGKLNKVISNELKISLKTVEAHRASVMRKMEVKSLPELVELVLKYDLCEQTENVN